MIARCCSANRRPRIAHAAGIDDPHSVDLTFKRPIGMAHAHEVRIGFMEHCWSRQSDIYQTEH